MRIPLEVPRGGGLVKEARRRSYAFRDSSFMASPLYRDGRKKDPRGETKEECEEREKRMTMRMKGSLSRESGDTLRIEQEEETKRRLKRKVEVLKKRKEDTLSLSPKDPTSPLSHHWNSEENKRGSRGEGEKNLQKIKKSPSRRKVDDTKTPAK